MLAYDTAVAVFNALTPEHRMDIWSEKMELLINDTSLNSQVRQFIEDVKDKFTVGMFSSPNSLTLKEVTEFIETQQVALNIPDTTIALFFAVPHTYAELMIAFQPVGLYGHDCTCNTKINTCFIRDYYKCGDMECDLVETGCGLFWRGKCDGTCSYY